MASRSASQISRRTIAGKLAEMKAKGAARVRATGVSEEVIAKGEDTDAYIELQPSAAEAKSDCDRVRRHGRYGVHSP